MNDGVVLNSLDTKTFPSYPKPAGPVTVRDMVCRPQKWFILGDSKQQVTIRPIDVVLACKPVPKPLGTGQEREREREGLKNKALEHKFCTRIPHVFHSQVRVALFGPWPKRRRSPCT